MWKKALLLGGLVMAIGLAGQAQAAPLFVQGESLNQDVAANDDAYLAGETVVVARDVRGDLFVGGGDITINGNVSGDLVVMGGTVTVNGRVSDDVRVMGGTVTIVNSVGDDLFIGAGSVTIADAAVIRGDLVAGTGTLNLYGRVNGSAKLGFGTGRINGKIDGNADVRYSEGLSFGKDARIAGQLNYWAPTEEASFSDYASKVQFHSVVDAGANRQGLRHLLTAAGLMAIIWKWLSLLFVGALMIWIFPKFFPKLVDSIKARSNTGQFVLAGFAFLILVPLLGGLFAVTVIGLPVAMIMFFAYVLMIIFSAIVGAYGLGSYLRRHRHATQWDQLANLALGTLTVLVVAHVPFIGGLFQALVIMFGLGVVWYEKVRLSAVYRKTAE
jgi:hypothetical protein